jgi:hypothetical protein
MLKFFKFHTVKRHCLAKNKINKINFVQLTQLVIVVNL